jgi:deoxyadenosine/deoxycytidine kinase
VLGGEQTTLAKALADRLGLPVYYEPTTDNVYLADFYKDIGKYSFAMQVRARWTQAAIVCHHLSFFHRRVCNR